MRMFRPGERSGTRYEIDEDTEIVPRVDLRAPRRSWFRKRNNHRVLVQRPSLVVILGDALRLVGIGVLVGLPLALAAARLLQGQLHGISSADPVALGLSLSVLVVSATLAALLPAFRASRVAPLVALREE